MGEFDPCALIAFDVDVLACPRGGGRLRLIALIEASAVTRRILTHLGLPAEVPTPIPAWAIRGATVQGDTPLGSAVLRTIIVAWNIGRGGGFPQPYVRLLPVT